MANPWHVRWLEEGVQLWNKRRKKVNFTPDLSGVRFFDFLPGDVRNRPRTTKFFERIDLSQANLEGSDLSGLNFSKANFKGAMLQRSNLSLSNFSRADFSEAQMQEARASHSVFSGATFIGADLQLVDFQDSTANSALFVESPLSIAQQQDLSDSRPQIHERAEEYYEVLKERSIYRTPQGAGGAEDNRTPKSRYDVYFGTNRAAIIEHGATKDFSGESSSQTSYGICEVFLPEKRSIGSLGPKGWRRFFNLSDDKARMDGIISLDSELFWKHLKYLYGTGATSFAPTLFVHGYNTSFSEAAIRAAQIGLDLGLGPGIGLFSWPSKGKKRAYVADAATAHATKTALADFIDHFTDAFPDAGINIIAHSMGCRALVYALDELAVSRIVTLKRVKQIILAAADVDVRDMQNIRQGSIAYCSRTTSYVSEFDKALWASKYLNSSPRVGFRPPTFVLRGIDTVAVNEDSLGPLAHGYVGTSRDVLNDIFALLKSNTPPAERFSIEQVVEGGSFFWRLKT